MVSLWLGSLGLRETEIAGSQVRTKRHYKVTKLQRNHQVNELEVTVNNTKPALTSFSDLNWPTIEIISTLTAKFDYWLQ